MLKYKQGDIIQAFETKEIDTFIIQENCTVGMGAGISKIVVNKYPEVKKYNVEQLRIAKEHPEDVLGLLIPYRLNSGRYIYGVYSQYFPGSPQLGFDTFKQRLNWLSIGLDAFKQNLNWLSIGLDAFKRNYPNTKLGLPLIASGLAKDKTLYHFSDLDYFKTYIAPTVEAALENIDVTIYYL